MALAGCFKFLPIQKYYDYGEADIFISNNSKQILPKIDLESFQWCLFSIVYFIWQAKCRESPSIPALSAPFQTQDHTFEGYLTWLCITTFPEKSIKNKGTCVHSTWKVHHTRMRKESNKKKGNIISRFCKSVVYSTNLNRFYVIEVGEKFFLPKIPP